MATDARSVAGDTETAAAPASRVCQDGRVLISEGHDNAPRWQEGERLERLFERRCGELHEQGGEERLAVDGPQTRLTYGELDARANQLARWLLAKHDVGPGERVAILFDDPVDSYVSMLAVLKLHATYVPLDAGFPPDRSSYIVSDAGVKTVLSRSHLAQSLAEVEDGAKVVQLDDHEDEITDEENTRLSDDESGDPVDDLCYVIYTSGTTGKPKGVAVGHAAICNFVQVAAEIYGLTGEDRVYQGLTVAFDFAIEEIWVPWMAGATLVPKPCGANLLGPELREFLSEHHVTAMCCVPTLLATLDEDLPELRFLLVSGEACPKDLVEKWHREDRRFLNVYGPTEATVSATWTVLTPDRAVTIGVPLPTYSILILDPEEDNALPLNEEGEIAIAGIGLADGYLGNPEKTEEAFIDDFLDLPDNLSGRIYRTGDLGAVNDDGEIEHRGRIDTQVKIRGYRIELEEIEALLRQEPGVEQAVVTTHEPEPEVQELAAFVQPESDPEGVDQDRVYDDLREKLPPYMVPTYLEEIESVPTQPSGKIDRQKLPEPSGERRVATQGEHVEADSEVESALAQKLAEILGLERVSVESHFFEELGASSLLMARFNAEAAKDADLPSVSMRDVYVHPTIRKLAEALFGEGSSGSTPEWEEPELPEPTGRPHHVLCGGLQVAAFLLYACLAALGFDLGAAWLSAAHGVLDIYARAVGVGAAELLAVGLAPIAAKWILVGRWKRSAIRVWSLAYVRFWIVKTLIISNPVPRLFLGTALYSLYLRALGAKIGPGTVILTRHPPVCTDLLEVGADSVIRKDSFFNGYRVRAGIIEIGPVAIGSKAFVGEQSVIEIDATLEDGAQLGHASTLHAGQTVPTGECWHGSPAQPAEDDADYQTVEPMPCGRLRRAAFPLERLGLLLATVFPLEAGGVTLLLTHPEILENVSDSDSLLFGAIALVGLLLIGLTVVGLIPRLLTRLLEPGKPYPLYGFHYGIQRLVARSSNIPPLTALFGDSAAIVGYLRLLGYDLGEVEQTGSNFGMDVRQEVPALSEVGPGTMVSDGLSMMNAEFSSSSFRVMPVAIGKQNFLGNRIAYPAEARTGDNCLLATKAMVPISGEVREGTGLLGSPCFEIPRSVDADEELKELGTGDERRRRLPAKTRHNVVTMALHLLVRLLFISALIYVALSPLGGGTGLGAMAGTALSIVLEIVLIPVTFFVLVERVLTRLQPVEPKACSIYQRDFWRVERYWKVPAVACLRILDGTPLKALVWRLLGVRMGKRVLDDGCHITERPLVSVGSDACLNMGSVLHSHSLEDGIFKSDKIVLEDGCTVGTSALVHYGVRLGRGANVEANAFVMKGSAVSESERWRGNPANAVSEAAAR